jgi:succinoglycan biosynthesis protein ExoM
MHISVCVCTYQRPVRLERLLIALSSQDTEGTFDYSIVIADNDAQESAKELVLSFAARSPIEIIYCVEPKRSISYARNKALACATGDTIAFIDDDEFPPENWLFLMQKALRDSEVSGVFGPVRPHFDTEPPRWVIKGRFFERPEHKTGFVMPWVECRTGNVLIRKQIIEGIDIIFDPKFGAGASDIDLFRRLINEGHKFIWCNEAFVSEIVSENRWKPSFMIKRALLRGRLSLLHPVNRLPWILNSLIAVPAYGLALPFLQLVGHHYFMLYMVKFFDHFGRLLAVVGLNPVRKRDM